MSNILLIEDDAWFGQLYYLLLQKAGHSVDWHRDAYAGLDALDDQKPDALVLDIMLPWANGIQLLGEIASHGDFADVPVVLCSSALPANLTPDMLECYGVVAAIDKTASNPKFFVQTVNRVAAESHARQL